MDMMETDSSAVASNSVLSGNLCYWKQNFPLHKPSAQIYQILHVLLYTNISVV